MGYETFGKPQMRPDLNTASRILRAAVSRSLCGALMASRSLSTYSSTRGTAAGQLLAVNVMAATGYQALLT